MNNTFKQHVATFNCSTWDELDRQLTEFTEEEVYGSVRRADRLSACHFHDGESMRYTAILIYHLERESYAGGPSVTDSIATHTGRGLAV